MTHGHDSSNEKRLVTQFGDDDDGDGSDEGVGKSHGVIQCPLAQTVRVDVVQ